MRVPLSVVIPVRDAAALLDDCLRAVMAQLADGDEVIVVDDGSRDGTAVRAERLGARVVTTAGVGPYAARDVGWRRARGEVVVFTDVRCRPKPGWLAALRAPFDDPVAAMACSSVRVRRGRTLAQRIAWRDQPHRVEAYVGGFLPYFATCNLAVRRDALTAVGGFRSVRGGGDADLCWRVQLAGLGGLVVVPGDWMEWQPRERMRDLVEQYARYGQGNAQLERVFATAGMATDHALDPQVALRRGLGRLARRVGHPLGGKPLIQMVPVLAFQYGYARERRRLRDGATERLHAAGWRNLPPSSVT